MLPPFQSFAFDEVAQPPRVRARKKAQTIFEVMFVDVFARPAEKFQRGPVLHRGRTRGKLDA